MVTCERECASEARLGAGLPRRGPTTGSLARRPAPLRPGFPRPCAGRPADAVRGCEPPLEVAGELHREPDIARARRTVPGIGELDQRRGHLPALEQELLDRREFDAEQFDLDPARAQGGVIALAPRDLGGDIGLMAPEQQAGELVEHRRFVDQLGIAILALHRQSDREQCGAP